MEMGVHLVKFVPPWGRNLGREFGSAEQYLEREENGLILLKVKLDLQACEIFKYTMNVLYL